MNGVFRGAMFTMSTIGISDTSTLVDCTEIIATAAPGDDFAAFPPTLSVANIDPSVPNVSLLVLSCYGVNLHAVQCGNDFSTLATADGPALIISPVPPSIFKLTALLLAR